MYHSIFFSTDTVHTFKTFAFMFFLVIFNCYITHKCMSNFRENSVILKTPAGSANQKPGFLSKKWLDSFLNLR